MRLISDRIGSNADKIKFLYDKQSACGRDTEIQVMEVPTKLAVVMPDPAYPIFTLYPAENKGVRGVLDIRTWP